MDCDTKAKIEKHIRKHRKSGGKAEAHEMRMSDKGAESASKGDDDAEKDLKDAPKDRSAPNNVGKEAEEMKAKKGGRVKRAHGGMMHKKEVGGAEGHDGHHHAGRKKRASGGGCEGNPFTSAMKSTQPKGRSVMAISEGGDH